MENHHFLAGKIHYFYSHFPLQNVSSPEGSLKMTAWMIFPFFRWPSSNWIPRIKKPGSMGSDDPRGTKRPRCSREKIPMIFFRGVAQPPTSMIFSMMSPLLLRYPTRYHLLISSICSIWTPSFKMLWYLRTIPNMGVSNFPKNIGWSFFRLFPQSIFGDVRDFPHLPMEPLWFLRKKIEDFRKKRKHHLNFHQMFHPNFQVFPIWGDFFTKVSPSRKPPGFPWGLPGEVHHFDPLDSPKWSDLDLRLSLGSTEGATTRGTSMGNGWFTLEKKGETRWNSMFIFGICI